MISFFLFASINDEQILCILQVLWIEEKPFHRFTLDVFGNVIETTLLKAKV